MRFVAYGYRFGERSLPAIEDKKVGAEVKPNELEYKHPAFRSPVGVSVGPHIDGVLLPHPDPGDQATTVAGVQKRVLRQPPMRNFIRARKFRRFVSRWIKRNLVPLASDSDVTVESWLAQTDYSQTRKDELLDRWNKVVCLDEDDRYFRVKSFIKDEYYDEFKHSRAINSRSDVFKCAVGPIFKLIEKEVFKNEFFIKKVPVCDRPKYIMRHVWRSNVRYFATDFTSFESCFTAEVMEDCEFQLYDFMTQLLPSGCLFRRLIHDVIGGTNDLIFKLCYAVVKATRMSGEMCTSLGNGFTNLMLVLFLCDDGGHGVVFGVVEGDDGLFSTSSGTFPTANDFADLGFIIKLVGHDDLCSASFCGIVFDEIDCVNVTDPKKVLVKFAWVNRQYLWASRPKHLALLRCKALSFWHQYPGCPIIQSLAEYGLRVTEHIDVSSILANHQVFSYWDRSRVLDALEAYRSRDKSRTNIIPMRTRFLIESKYGISLPQQLRLETLYDSKLDLGPVNTDLVFPVDWVDYGVNYTMNVHRDNSHCPGLNWARCKFVYSKEHGVSYDNNG